MREEQRGESCGGARVCEGRPVMFEARPIAHLLLPGGEVVEVGEREILPAVEPLAVRGQLLPLHRLGLAPVVAIGGDVEVVTHHAWARRVGGESGQRYGREWRAEREVWQRRVWQRHSPSSIFSPSRLRMKPRIASWSGMPHSTNLSRPQRQRHSRNSSKSRHAIASSSVASPAFICSIL